MVLTMSIIMVCYTHKINTKEVNAMVNDFIKAIGDTKTKGFKAAFELVNGQVAITAEYSLPILKMVISEIKETVPGAKFIEIISA